MSFSVKVRPSDHRFVVNTGETLLDAALRQGIALPYGCRNGACGACKGKVLSGEFDHGKAKPFGLNDAERAAGLALFCCAIPQSDLEIEAREAAKAADVPAKTLRARIESLEKAAPDVMIVRLKLPAGDRLQFLAGQYIDILLNDDRRRSFSLANAPHDDALLELHVRLVPDGHFTPQLFSNIKEKDLVRINGPHGSFYLREESTKPAILLAGGTGFAPIKSLIEHAVASQSQRQFTVYWGARRLVDLYQRDAFARWAAENGVGFVPVLSEPAAADAWQGRCGLVHEAVLSDFPDLAGHQVYACGAPAMIDAARRDFAAHGQLPDGEFFADAFSFADDAAS